MHRGGWNMRSSQDAGPEVDVELGLLKYQESSLDKAVPYLLSIETASIKLPDGVDPKKFAYTIPQYQTDHVKKLKEYIQKSLFENLIVTDLMKEKKEISISLTKDGNCFAVYQDDHGIKKKVPLLHFRPEAAELYKVGSKQKEFEKSFFVLKRAIKHERWHRLVREVDTKIKLPVGKYNPKYVAYERWTRMFEEIRRILADKTREVSPETAKHCQFFLAQYLERIARVAGYKATEEQLDTTPLDRAHFGYHRDYEDDNPALKLINLNVKKAIGDQGFVLSVSEAAQYAKTLTTVLKGNTCLLSMTDDKDVLAKKIKEGIDKKGEGPILFQFDIPSGAEQSKLLEFNAKIHSIFDYFRFSNPNENAIILGLGKLSESHHFIWSDHDSFEMQTICAHNGFTPSMQQAARIIGEEVPLEELKGQLEDSLPAVGPGLRTGSLIVSDFKGLLESATFKHFSEKFVKKSLNTDHDLLGDNICRALKGLEQYPIDETFKSNGLSILLQELYAQILDFMEIIMASDFKKDPFSKFHLSDFTTLIFEDINFMLEMAMNVKEAKKKLDAILQDKVLPEAKIRPAVSGMVNSGVRCFPTILNACIACKHGETKAEEKTSGSKVDKSKLNILGFNDSYYEIVESIEKHASKSHIVTPPNYDKSLQDKITELRGSGKKLDLLFVDPQGSLDVNTNLVSAHDVDKIIHDLIEDTVDKPKVAQKPLTVVMDVTIGKINDAYVTNLLNKYQEQIEAGELNIVCFRSIQKFDQFGIDKLSGGYFQAFSSNHEFIASMQQSALQEAKDVDPINIKGLTHLYEHCAEGLDAYRQRTFQNANTVYNSIYKIFTQPDAVPGLPLTVDERRNADNYFIVFRSPDIDVNSSSLTSALRANGFYFDTRPSFGFSYTSECTITHPEDPEKDALRITFGLEDKDQIAIFHRTFNELMLAHTMREIINPQIDAAVSATFTEPDSAARLTPILQDFCIDIIPHFSSFNDLKNYMDTTFVHALKESKKIATTPQDIENACLMHLLRTQGINFNPVRINERMIGNRDQICDAFVAYVNSLGEEQKEKQLEEISSILKGDTALGKLLNTDVKSLERVNTLKNQLEKAEVKKDAPKAEEKVAAETKVEPEVVARSVKRRASYSPTMFKQPEEPQTQATPTATPVKRRGSVA